MQHNLAEKEIEFKTRDSVIKVDEGGGVFVVRSFFDMKSKRSAKDVWMGFVKESMK